MITGIKRKDINKLTTENDIGDTAVYYAADLSADKIRSIYAMMGRFDMLDYPQHVDDLVIRLIINAAELLLGDPKSQESESSSGGVSVKMFFEKGYDNLMLEINFRIV